MNLKILVICNLIEVKKNMCMTWDLLLLWCYTIKRLQIQMEGFNQ